jgi:hypothetical protein
MSGHLGVSQIYSFEKNRAIILTHHEKHGEAITKQRATFLIVCWKGIHRETARQLKEEYDKFLRLPEYKQKQEVEQARKLIQSQYITLEVTM